MNRFSSTSQIFLTIVFLHFGLLVLGFGSTWELYQVFNSKHGENSTSSRNKSTADPDTGSRIPLIFTFKPNQKVDSLTTGKGRVLFVGKKEIIPRYISNHSNSNSIEESERPALSGEKIDPLFLKSEANTFSFSSVLGFILQFINVDDVIEWLATLKQALISYYGSNYNLLGGRPSSKSNEISTGRDGWGGIGFPSLEGALLSLAFLTFAVFLIDLIQNLLANLRVPTTAIGGNTGVPDLNDGGGMIQIPTRGKRAVRESNWMSTLTKSVFSAIEQSL